MSDATTLVLFGAAGDLVSRLLLPALGQLLQVEPDRQVRLIGVDRDERTDDEMREIARTAFEKSDATASLARMQIEYRQVDIAAPDELRALLADLRAPALYFAVPPAVTVAACNAMTADMLPEGTMLALEKPFGVDEASARDLNRRLTALVPERQLFRIDHFLGRATTLNLLGTRFANRILQPLWSAEDIESVAIIYDEKLALEGRAGYYDHAGAFVDMVQSHLLQVLAVLAMEQPATLNEIDFREATSAVLRAVAVWGDDPTASSRRARYTAGSVDGIAKPSYIDEPEVDATRNTETLAEATFEVHNARWAGVPFTVRSGKALGNPAREIVVRFRAVRHLPVGFRGHADGAILRFSLGPDSFSLELNVNGPNDPLELERAVVSTELGPGALAAYAEVLSGILDSDPMLSVRGDAAEECWRIIAPIRDAWRRDEVPLDEYAAGSEGPDGWPKLR